MQMIKTKKAILCEMDANFVRPVNPGKTVTAQINPKTLRIGNYNQIIWMVGTSQPTNGQLKPFIISGGSKLSVQLLFDLTGSAQEIPLGIADIRPLMKQVGYFLTPLSVGKNLRPPRPMRFKWGSFVFDGYMASMEEIREAFLANGRPQRAIVSLSIIRQKFTTTVEPGTGSVIQATDPGGTIQGLAAGQGQGGDWQSVAIGTAIENPRALTIGDLFFRS